MTATPIEPVSASPSRRDLEAAADRLALADAQAEVARLRTALRYAAHQIDHVTNHPEWDVTECLRTIACHTRFVASEAAKGPTT